MNGVVASGRFQIDSYDQTGIWLGRAVFRNGVTVEGVNGLLNREFRGVAGYQLWYIGLINDAGFSALAADDTHVLHPGWSEFNGVGGGVRAQWVPLPAQGGLMDSTYLVIPITASGYVRGAFLASTQTIGMGAGQVIYATGVASAGVQVAASGRVVVSYKIRLTPR